MWSEFVDGTNLIQRSWCGSRVAVLSHVSYKHSLCRNSSLTLSSSPLILIPSSSHGLPSPSHPVTLSSFHLPSPSPNTRPFILPSIPLSSSFTHLTLYACVYLPFFLLLHPYPHPLPSLLSPSLHRPRGSAVGERLWSPQDVTNTTDADIRLHNQRCRMVR